MKYFKSILLACVALSTSACLGRTKISNAKEEILLMVNDPTSVLWGELHTHETNEWVSQGFYRKYEAVCGTLNAKNGFGAYTGQTPFIHLTVDGRSFVDFYSSSDKDKFIKIWNDYCSPDKHINI